MKTDKLKRTVLLALIVCILTPIVILGADGGGKVKVGYTYMDQEGSMAVNQETYNWYEGPALSLQDWRIDFADGSALTADLRNITLNNRNLRISYGKSGLFNLSAANNQYRRFHDFNGGNFTRRNHTDIQGSVQPIRWVKFFGGYSVTMKHGDVLPTLSPATEMTVRNTDYDHTSFNAGMQVGDRFGMLRTEYRHYAFDDKTATNTDRTADNFTVSLFSKVPRVDRLTLSGGYKYRQDKIQDTDEKLTSNQFWLGGRVTLPESMVFDYRLVYGYTTPASAYQVSTSETDHILHTTSLGKNWGRLGGVRLGYEYQIADDFINKTSSSGVLANGWLRPNDRWYFRGNVATRTNSVDEGSTLLGNEDLTRQMLAARYSAREGCNLSIQWQGRSRKNADIRSKVDYNALSSDLNLTNEKWGSIVVGYAYNRGTFENRSDTVSFEFADHVVSGTISPRAYKNLAADFGWNYYRSKRDIDIEKFNLNFGLTYAFLANHHVEVRYNVFNYDDFIVTNSYYTANIVEVNLTKDLSF